MVGRIWEWLSQTPSAMSPILSRFSSSSSTFQILLPRLNAAAWHQIKPLSRFK